jgi:hypothetical protein
LLADNPNCIQRPSGYRRKPPLGPQPIRSEQRRQGVAEGRVVANEDRVHVPDGWLDRGPENVNLTLPVLRSQPSTVSPASDVGCPIVPISSRFTKKSLFNVSGRSVKTPRWRWDWR